MGKYFFMSPKDPRPVNSEGNKPTPQPNIIDKPERKKIDSLMSVRNKKNGKEWRTTKKHWEKTLKSDGNYKVEKPD